MDDVVMGRSDGVNEVETPKKNAVNEKVAERLLPRLDGRPRRYIRIPSRYT